MNPLLAPDTKAILCARVFEMRVNGVKPTRIAELLDVPVNTVLACVRKIADDFEAENADLIRDAYVLAQARYEHLTEVCLQALEKRCATGDFPIELVKLALMCQAAQDKLLGHGSKRPGAPDLDDKDLPALLEMARDSGVRLPPLTYFPQEPRITYPCPSQPTSTHSPSR